MQFSVILSLWAELCHLGSNLRNPSHVSTQDGRVVQIRKEETISRADAISENSPYPPP
jgi:hypothetical protein